MGKLADAEMEETWLMTHKCWKPSDFHSDLWFHARREITIWHSKREKCFPNISQVWQNHHRMPWMILGRRSNVNFAFVVCCFLLSLMCFHCKQAIFPRWNAKKVVKIKKSWAGDVCHFWIINHWFQSSHIHWIACQMWKQNISKNTSQLSDFQNTFVFVSTICFVVKISHEMNHDNCAPHCKSHSHTPSSWFRQSPTMQRRFLMWFKPMTKKPIGVKKIWWMVGQKVNWTFNFD